MDHPRSQRAGRMIRQPGSFTAYIPAPLPPEPPLLLDQALLARVSRADRAIGKLDGIALVIPDHDLFVAMYVRKEAVESSRIEGTQSTLQDVLTYEVDRRVHVPRDIEEVVNYVKAMNYGIARLASLPLSLRLICEIHEKLMQGARGGTRAPGEFRTTQNWIGPAGASLARASFVPPPVPNMHEALNELERYLHQEDYPPLIQAALIHAQFETIHPFLDGNGRVGRLLVTLYLIHAQAIRQPLLYLSAFIKRHRGEYYDRLMAIRFDGNWEGWVGFFLEAVTDTADDAVNTAAAIDDLRAELRSGFQQTPGGASARAALDVAFEHPILNVAMVERRTGTTYTTAARSVGSLVDLGILREITGQRRNRIYRFDRYLDLFERDEDTVADLAPVELTDSA